MDAKRLQRAIFCFAKVWAKVEATIVHAHNSIVPGNVEKKKDLQHLHNLDLEYWARF